MIETMVERIHKCADSCTFEQSLTDELNPLDSRRKLAREGLSLSILIILHLGRKCQRMQRSRQNLIQVYTYRHDGEGMKIIKSSFWLIHAT